MTLNSFYLYTFLISIAVFVPSVVYMYNNNPDKISSFKAEVIFKSFVFSFVICLFSCIMFFVTK